jgi:hypothetical protein
VFEDPDARPTAEAGGATVDPRFLLLESSLYKGVRSFRLGPNHPLRTQLGVESVPAVVVLDAKSNVAVKETRYLTKAELHAALEKVTFFFLLLAR